MMSSLLSITERNGVRNLARAHDDALLAKVTAPPPKLSRNPLDGHDVALYVDGKRISLTFLDVTDIEGGLVSILAETTIEAALDPQVEGTLSLAWGGFRPEDTVDYRVAPTEPSGGVFQIESVHLPETPDGPAYFVGTALTDLHDWSDDGRKIAAAGDRCEVLTTHVQRQS